MRVSMPAFVLAALLAAAAARAADPMDLTWDRLAPGGGALSGIVGHGEAPADGAAGAADYEVVDDFNGETVRLPGYLVPLDLGPDGGAEFLLVPYFGACIHVPPPPPNQIVYVTTEEPYMLEALFEPVSVTGKFDVVALTTDLAETAYALSEASVEAYVYE